MSSFDIAICLGLSVAANVISFLVGWLFGWEKAWAAMKKLDETNAERKQKYSIEDRLTALEKQNEPR